MDMITKRHIGRSGERHIGRSGEGGTSEICYVALGLKTMLILSSTN